MATRKQTNALTEFYKRTHPQVKHLSLVTRLHGPAALLYSWTFIYLTIIICEHLDSWFFYPFALVIIAARQHGLLALMHEGTHFRLWPRVITNDFITEFFSAYPLFLKMKTYRTHHLKHHSFLNSTKDTSWTYRICYPEWQFPMNRNNFLYHYKKFLYGFGIIDMWRLWKMFSGLAPKDLKIRETRKGLYSQVLFYFTLIGLLLISNSFLIIFLKYWLAPMITVLPFLMRIRDVAEHFGLQGTHELNMTRNVICPLWERFLIMPFNTSLHLDHHLFPSVPFYNLPRLHSALMNDDFYRTHAHNNKSYLGTNKQSMIHDLITK